MKKVILVIGLFGGCLFGAAFQNGGFENPVAPFNFNIVPTGWTKFDPSCGNIANCSGSGLFMENYSTFGLPTTGGQGVQAFGFGGNGTLTGTLLQSFDTIPLATYRISFQHVIQQGTGNEDLILDILNGAISAPPGGADPAPCTGSPDCLATTGRVQFNNSAWVTRTIDFVAAGPTTTARFFDASGNFETTSDHSSTNWALDAVTVTELAGPPTGVPSGVPEPATWPLIAAAVALAAVRRTRRRA